MTKLLKRKTSKTPEAKKAQTQLWTRDFIQQSTGRAVAAYLTSSYIYYHCPDLPDIMTDGDFDWLCSYLLRKWRAIDHQHKYLIDRESLKAGTGFAIRKQEYPNIVVSLAVSMAMGNFKPFIPAKTLDRRKPSKAKPTPRRRSPWSGW